MYAIRNKVSKQYHQISNSYEDMVIEVFTSHTDTITERSSG